MEFTYECPACQKVGRVAHVESAAQIVCRSCGRTREVSAGACTDGDLAFCAFCATTDLYVQKDFPHVLGLGIVVVGFVISSVFWAFYMPVGAITVLMLTALLDLLLYYLVPDVTICYRCQGQYRGRGSNSGERFHPFDLAVGERYRQERLRAEELRQQRRAAQGDRVAASAEPGASRSE